MGLCREPRGKQPCERKNGRNRGRGEGEASAQEGDTFFVLFLGFSFAGTEFIMKPPGRCSVRNRKVTHAQPAITEVLAERVFARADEWEGEKALRRR